MAKTIEVSDGTYKELCEIAALITNDANERHCRAMGTWKPEDVIPYMIGFLASHDPRINKIAYQEGV